MKDVKCKTCDKEFVIPDWDYNRRMIRGKRDNAIFCSKVCSLTGRVLSEKSRQKISSSQKYTSYQSRGRKGHPVSEETKHKIRMSKIGVSSKTDWDIIAIDAKERGISRYAVMRAPIPDYVYAEQNRLIAVEIEKEQWEVGIRSKMNEYLGYHDKWDKVILVWRLPTGRKMKEWVLENGCWRLITS